MEIVRGFFLFIKMCAIIYFRRIFLMGGMQDERVKDSFPYGWEVG
jgi:hypothetical protein